MRDPLRSKVRFLLLTSLALVLGLGVASGFRWAQGKDPKPGAPLSFATQTQGPTSTLEPVATESSPALAASARNFEALAEVSQAFVAIARSVTPAVVSVDTRGTPQRLMRLPQRFEDLFGPAHPEIEQTPFDVPLGRGSGFIVSEDGYILTNNHVVAAAERISVELLDGRRFDAELVGRDPTTDIAVLKVDGGNLPTVKLGQSETAEVGEFVLAIGNPGTELTSALPFTVTSGIISAKGRNLGIIQRAAQSNWAIEDLIQTDAVINPGNSGGPLVNYRGEVIGVNTAIQSLTGYYQGYGFAIPISLARDVLDDLIEHGRVRRGALRVQITAVTPADARKYELPEPRGVVVQDFESGSPAAKAGMQPGDVIVAVEGRRVERVGQLQRVIASFEPGDRVNVDVIRYGKPMTFRVRLGEADVVLPEPARAEAASRPGDMLLGVKVRDLTPSLAAEARFDPDADLEGVLVSEVARFGPAWNAGIAPGMLIQKVNGRSIRNVDAFDDVLAKVGAGDVVSFDVIWPRGEGRLNHRIINVEIPREE